MKAFLNHHFFIFLFCCFGLQVALSQTIKLSNTSEVSVLTCGTGNESYSLFGHTAIRVKDPQKDIDVVYNFGAFDFGTPNFVMKFAKGDLQYFAVANSFTDFISNYTYEQRSVFEQELNISLELKQEIFDNLNQSLLLENREYTYKFIDKNCTSMSVDILNKSFKNNIIVKKGDTISSYRSILFPYFDNHFYEKLGTSIIFGSKTDEKGSKIFLPYEFKNSLSQTYFQHKPLIKKTSSLLNFESKKPFSWWNNIYTYLLLLCTIVLVNNKLIDKFYLLFMAILGVFFLSMGFYSNHLELANNYNVLLFNPCLFALVYFFNKTNSKLALYSSIANLMMLAVYIFMVVNKAHFWIVLPLIVTNTILIFRRFLKFKSI